jgi:antitoxin MazE
MEVQIINVGNSKGILLNKTILEKYGFGDKIEIIMKQDHLELKPVSPPREGWDEAFKEMHDREEDNMLIDDVLDDDLFEEWEWK